jgi:hypothetical protein
MKIDCSVVTKDFGVLSREQIADARFLDDVARARLLRAWKLGYDHERVFVDENGKRVQQPPAEGEGR